MKPKTLFYSSLLAAAAMSTVPAWADTTGSTDSIWINFDSEQGTGADGYTGTWNDTTDKSGTNVSLKYSDTAGTASGASLTYSSPNVWSYTAGVTDGVLKGYLDDGSSGSGVSITVSNISYLVYDVTVFAATDTASVKFSAKTLNGNTYTSDGSGNGILGSGSWGASRQASINNNNSFTVSGLTGDLSLSSVKNGTARGCVAGLIITNAAAGVSAVAATLDGTASTWTTTSLAGTDWTNSTETAPTYANLTMSADTELTLGSGVITDAIWAHGSGALTLAGEELTFRGVGVLRADTGTSIVVNNTLNFTNGGTLSKNITLGDNGELHVSGGTLNAVALTTTAASFKVSLEKGATYVMDLSTTGSYDLSTISGVSGSVISVGSSTSPNTFTGISKFSDNFNGAVNVVSGYLNLADPTVMENSNVEKIILSGGSDSGLCFVQAQGITISKDIVAEGNGGALRSYANNDYSVKFTGNVSGTSISHVDGGTHTFSGTVDLDSFSAVAGVTNFSGTGTNTITTLKLTGTGSTLNFSGTGTNTIGTLYAQDTAGTNRTISIAEGTTVSVGNITNTWGIQTLTVDGDLTVTGTMRYSSGSMTNTINGSGTLTAATFTSANVGTYVFSGELNTNITTLNATTTTTTFANTGTNTIGTLYSQVGTINIGDGTNTVVVSATRVELGDSGTSGTTDTLNIKQNATLAITGSNNGNDYKSASLLLSEWTGTTTANISGALLAKDAKLLRGNLATTLNISGGTLAVKGFYAKTTSGNAVTVNVSDSGKLILGSGGVSGIDSVNVSLNNGTFAASESSIAFSKNIALTGAGTIDTTKYDFASDGKSISQGTDAAAITLAGVISGTGALNVTGAGTLTLSGENAFTGGTTISAGTLVANNASALGTGDVSVKSGAMLSTVSGTQLAVGGDLTTESGAFLGMAAATTDAVAIAVTGTVSLNAGTIFDFSSLTAGESLNIQLVSGTGVSADNLGLANLSVNGALVNQRGSASFSVSDDNVLSLDSYTAGGAATLTWNSDSTGAWKNAGTREWTLGTSTDKFYNGDSVIFNTANAEVELSGAVAPDAMTVSAATTLSGTGTVSVAAANLTTSETLTLGDNVTLDLGSSGAVSKKVSGTGTVKFTSTAGGHGGTLTLGNGFTGTIDYTGKFDTSNGTANPNAKFRLSGGSMWGSNEISNEIHFLTNYQIGDTDATTMVLNGKVTNESGTTLTIGGTNPTVTFGGEMAVSTLTQSAGTLNISGTGTKTIGTLNVTGGSTSFTGTGTTEITTLTLTGTNSVNISGTGTWTFGTISTSNGSAGKSTLTIAEGTTVSATSFTNGWGLKTLTVNGTLNVDGTFQYGSGSTTNAITGTGTISAKTFDFGNNGTYNVSGVTLKVGSGGIIHSNTYNYVLNLGDATVKATDDFTFAVDGPNGSTKLTNTTTGTTFDTDGHAITVAAIFKDSGNLIKTGAGTLKLSSANTFTGDVTVTAGTLEVSNTSALGSSGTTTVNEGGVLKVSVADGVNAGTGAVKFASGAKFAVDLTAYSEVEVDNALSIITASAISFNDRSLGTVTLTSEEIEKYFSATDSNLGDWATGYTRKWGYDTTNSALTLTLTIPEPSTFGLLAGVGALAFVAARRRRRAK